jgi:hypothetical protein
MLKELVGSFIFNHCIIAEGFIVKALTIMITIAHLEQLNQDEVEGC